MGGGCSASVDVHSKAWAEDPSSSNKPIRIVLVGLDGCGKSSIWNRIESFVHNERVSEHVPLCEPSYNVRRRELSHNGKKFVLVDTPGKFWLRSTWVGEVQRSNCVVYAIDSSDKMRLQLAKDELIALQTRVPDFKERKFIVLLTKADHPNAIPKSCIEKEADFTDINVKMISFSARKNEDVKSLLDRCIGVL
mmetsp:Transcript_31500/g.43850  ORF Transcript_31500/g.43850 Transcript_31500/m.43850 type:complete len:193 (-) Transcript_31500:32-610(-)